MKFAFITIGVTRLPTDDYVHGLPRKLYPNIGVPDREAGRAAAPPDVNHSGKNCAIFGQFLDIYTR